MPTTVPISTVESGTKPNSVDPRPKKGVARANAVAATVVQSRRELGRLRHAAPPRAQNEHDAEFGEQRDDEPRGLERGLADTEEQEERGEGQQVEAELRSPKTTM